MSSVLHPVGPEPRERYWVRRLAVVVAAIVAIGVVIALVGNAMSAGSAVQAEPAPPSLPTTVPVTPSASPTPVGSASPTPTPGATSPTPGATSPTPGATTPTAGTTPTSSATPTAGSTVTPDPKQTAKPATKTKPTETDKRKAAQQAAEKKAAAKKKAAATPALAACPADDLRPTLIGPKKVKATKSAGFAVSLTNGSKKSCYVKVTSANFTLTVVSGKDRVWSTQDCPAAVPSQSRKLAADKSVDWKVTWDGHRSAAGCKHRSEKPRPGYYWAIAKFDDAKEVRWRVVLT